MIAITYDKDSNTIHATFRGDIGIKEVTDYFNKIQNQYGHLNRVFVLENLDDAQLKLNYKFIENDLVQIRSTIQQLTDHFEVLKIATLIGNYGNRSFLQFFSKGKLKTTGYYHKIFDSQTDATNWLYSDQE